jgi:hypothetical protein
VVYTYNPSYSGAGDQEYLWLRPALAKVSQTPSQPIKLGKLMYACHPSYIVVINRRIMVKAGQGKMKDPVGKKK